MARILFDEGLFSVIDEASAIGVGWRLTFYTANTTSTINSYSAPSGGVANTIPVLSDAQGRFPQMWLDDGQTIKWALANELGEIITTVDDFDIPSQPPSFNPDLDDFLTDPSADPLPIAYGGTGETSAVNALAALGGMSTNAPSVSGQITQTSRGVYHFWESAALTFGNHFLIPEGDPDPAGFNSPGHVLMKYTP